MIKCYEKIINESLMRFFFQFNSATAYQQDTRYSSNYTQPDYNASQYGASTDYNNTTSSDYPQTGAYDNRSYGGYGESKQNFSLNIWPVFS